MSGLRTKWFDSINKSCPLPEYPRPYLVRDSYLNLNGIWNYEITTSSKLPKTFSGEIVGSIGSNDSILGFAFGLDAKL